MNFGKVRRNGRRCYAVDAHDNVALANAAAFRCGTRQDTHDRQTRGLLRYRSAKNGVARQRERSGNYKRCKHAHVIHHANEPAMHPKAARSGVALGRLEILVL